MNYIDKLAIEIYQEAEKTTDVPNPKDEMLLYRMYAILVLTTGVRTNNRNVHDAWSAWRAETMPDHRSLIPFEELSKEVQSFDEPYTQAIIEVAKRIRADNIRKAKFAIAKALKKNG